MPRNARTPVIVGIGFDQERTTDPLAASEPYRLMVRAVQRAAEDAGAAQLVSQLESIAVTRGMWQYRNPGLLIRDALGCSKAKSVLAELGVLQLGVVSELCRAIAAGEQTIGVIVGGEAQFRGLRATITGQSVHDTEQPENGPPPDVHHVSQDPFCSDLEGVRGLHVPVEHFSIIESALRHHRGLGIEAHRDAVARLYAGFSEVAAANPHAWRREPTPADEIRDASPRNPMLAFPYTKRHCTQWNVNAAVAILVCAAGTAEALGLDERRWIYPLAGAESRHVVVLAQQPTLYSRAGSILCGERALGAVGLERDDVDVAELYSCFPAAIQSFAYDLRLPERCPWTITGSMAFAGGPFNHASLDGVARMVEVLREAGATRRVGLVSNLSGIFGKQAVATFSNVPTDDGIYRHDDVTAAAAARDVPVPIADQHVGPAVIVGYTVAFQNGAPSHAIAVCDTPAATRTVVRSDEAALVQTMTREEFCGRTVQVRADGGFVPVS